MKKLNLKSLWGRLGISLILVIAATIIHSCRKDTKQPVTALNPSIAAENLSVKDAKTWFGNNKADLAKKVKINSEASFLNKIADFTPVWDSARTALDTNYYVVEAPARYLKRLGFSTDSNGQNVNGITRLLVLKSKKYGNVSAVLMQIHGDVGVNINNVHYMDVPQTFSGSIFYTSLQGLFINGYIYRNGQITNVSAGQAKTHKPDGPQLLNEQAPDDCDVIILDWYTQTCYYAGDGTPLGCTEWEYDHTDVITFCQEPVGGSGGGVAPPTNCNNSSGDDSSGDDGGGSGSGGGVPVPVDVESQKGKLIVRSESTDEDNPCETCEEQKATFDIYNEALITQNTISVVDVPDETLAQYYRKQSYQWEFITNKSGYWKGVSYETGVHKWVYDHWEWVSLTHNHVSLVGTTFIVTMELSDVTNTPTILNPNSAYMTITVHRKASFLCKGMPFSKEEDVTATSDVWSLK